jgi:hypothetical protein
MKKMIISILLLVFINGIYGNERNIIINRIDGLNDLLIESVNYHEDISEIPNRCNFYVGCDRTRTIWVDALYPVPNLVQNPKFINVSVNYNETMTKIPFISEYSSEENQDICKSSLMKDQWNQNVNNINGSGILFQYYGNTNSSFTVYPAINWKDTGGICPRNIEGIDNDYNQNDYNPTIRPWYITGVSGQKNLIILIDISDSSTNATKYLELQKEAAISFLRTLSIHDFALVVFYYDIALSDQTEMIRATNDNIDYLINIINNINIVENTRSNLYEVFEGTFEIIENSIADDETSGCHNIIMLFSFGKNGNSIQKPITSINEHSDLEPKIFSYIFSDDDHINLDLSDLACETDGNLFTIKDSFDITESIESMNRYYGNFLNVITPRLSEPYTDALGQGRIFTPALPSYTINDEGLKILSGVHGADVSINSITTGTNLTENDMTQIILESATCEQFEIDERLKQIQTKKTCLKNYANDSGKLEVEENIGWFIALAVIVFLFVVFTPCLSCYSAGYHKYLADYNKYRTDWHLNKYIQNTRKTSYFGICSCCGGDCALVLWSIVLTILMSVIIGLVWMDGGIFEEATRYHNFVSTELTIERKIENPYRCCDIVNCQCQYYNGLSCNQLKNNLVEGICQNGFHCCQKRCRICNCRQSCTGSGASRSCATLCDTCCKCTQSVSQRRCESECGSCYRPMVTFSFKNNNGDISYSSLSTSCSRNNQECIDEFFSRFADIGESQRGYVNPVNNSEIAISIDYNLEILIPYIIISVIIAYIVISFWIAYNFCGDKCCTLHEKWRSK